MGGGGGRDERLPTSIVSGSLHGCFETQHEVTVFSPGPFLNAYSEAESSFSIFSAVTCAMWQAAKNGNEILSAPPLASKFKWDIGKVLHFVRCLLSFK